MGGIVALVVTFAMCGDVAQAQQPGKISRIGILFYGSRDQPHLKSFQQGLRDLEYIEGKNIVLEYRYAEGKSDRLAALAADLVRLPVDIIVTTTSQGARAAQRATRTIPIVMTTGDPIGSGLAATLAKPGGNVTGLQLKSFEVDSVETIDSAFSEMAKARPQALVVILSPLITLYSKRIVGLAVKNRLPGMYATRQFVEEGGLMAYGVTVRKFPLCLFPRGG